MNEIVAGGGYSCKSYSHSCHSKKSKKAKKAKKQELQLQKQVILAIA
jgi:hypothetical protein